MTRKVLIIFTWLGDQDRIERHEPYWKRSGCQLLYSFPCDAPLTIRPGFCSQWSEQYGESMLKRHIDTLRFCYDAGFDSVYATEADSICLKAAPEPFGTSVGGYVFNDPDNERFRASTFTHWAWSFNRDVLGRFLDAAESDTDALREKFPDRWLSLICERHNIPLRHDDRVWSRNQLDQPDIVRDARQAVQDGVWAIHGVKHSHQLDELLR